DGWEQNNGPAIIVLFPFPDFFEDGRGQNGFRYTTDNCNLHVMPPEKNETAVYILLYKLDIVK
ncbi:MAG: hypothetical protein ACD_81C00178G0001, partial [uncultured bacterium]